jgi:hypothetical protein
MIETLDKRRNKMKLTTETGKTIWIRHIYSRNGDLTYCDLFDTLERYNENDIIAGGRTQKNPKDSPNKVMARQVSFQRALKEYTVDDVLLYDEFWRAYQKKYRTVKE